MNVLDLQSRITTYLRDPEFRQRGFGETLPEIPEGQRKLLEKTVRHFTRDRTSRVGELFTEFLNVMDYLHWKDPLFECFVNRFRTGGWDRIDELDRFYAVSIDFLNKHSTPVVLYDLLEYCAVSSRLAEHPMREVRLDDRVLVPLLRGPAQVVELQHDITKFIAGDESIGELLESPPEPVVLFIVKDMDVPRTVHVLRSDDTTIPQLLCAKSPLESYVGLDGARVLEQLLQLTEYGFIKWAGGIERR